jgi:tRNA A37 methylthiotransferase MiaB
VVEEAEGCAHGCLCCRRPFLEGEDFSLRVETCLNVVVVAAE